MFLDYKASIFVYQSSLEHYYIMLLTKSVVKTFFEPGICTLCIFWYDDKFYLLSINVPMYDYGVHIGTAWYSPSSSLVEDRLTMACISLGFWQPSFMAIIQHLAYRHLRYFGGAWTEVVRVINHLLTLLG
jgi:hypothetical protein